MMMMTKWMPNSFLSPTTRSLCLSFKLFNSLALSKFHVYSLAILAPEVEGSRLFATWRAEALGEGFEVGYPVLECELVAETETVTGFAALQVGCTVWVHVMHVSINEIPYNLCESQRNSGVSSPTNTTSSGYEVITCSSQTDNSSFLAVIGVGILILWYGWETEC